MAKTGLNVALALGDGPLQSVTFTTPHIEASARSERSEYEKVRKHLGVTIQTCIQFHGLSYVGATRHWRPKSENGALKAGSGCQKLP